MDCHARLRPQYNRKSLPPFLAITPCGIQGVKMTCLEDEMSSPAGRKPVEMFRDVLQRCGKKITGIKGEFGTCGGA